MTTANAVKKVEKAFGEKMNYNPRYKKYSLNGLTFFDQQGEAICIAVNGGFRDNLTQALKWFNK